MLLSPASPSLAAALVGTSDGDEVVAVAVDVVVSGDVAASADDTRVGVTVVSVMPAETVLTTMVTVQDAVDSEVVDVDGSEYEVQLVSKV